MFYYARKLNVIRLDLPTWPSSDLVTQLANFPIENKISCYNSPLLAGNPLCAVLLHVGCISRTSLIVPILCK